MKKGTLWDVNVLYGNFFLIVQRVLVKIDELRQPTTDQTVAAANDQQLDALLGEGNVFVLLIAEAKKLELERTLDRVQRFADFMELRKNQLHDAKSRERVSAELRALNEAIEDDLAKRLVFFPRPEKIEYHEKPRLFGEAVYEGFPSARADITSAGNCFATENDTACIFHLMRAAEHGMRALARRLRIKKVGRHPLEYAEWGPICGALSKKIGELQQKGRSAKKAADLKFYADLASQADYLNEIWRKGVAHARMPYNSPEALNAFTRVRQFMETLAERVKEY